MPAISLTGASLEKGRRMGHSGRKMNRRRSSGSSGQSSTGSETVQSVKDASSLNLPSIRAPGRMGGSNSPGSGGGFTMDALTGSPAGPSSPGMGLRAAQLGLERVAEMLLSKATK